MNNGPFTRYGQLRVVHAPWMPGMFSPPPRVSDPYIHHSTYVTHVPWCMLGSLTSGFRCSRWRGKRSRHSRRMCNPQFHVSGKRPMAFLSVRSPLFFSVLAQFLHSHCCFDICYHYPSYLPNNHATDIRIHTWKYDILLPNLSGKLHTSLRPMYGLFGESFKQHSMLNTWVDSG